MIRAQQQAEEESRQKADTPAMQVEEVESDLGELPTGWETQDVVELLEAAEGRSMPSSGVLTGVPDPRFYLQEDVEVDDLNTTPEAREVQAQRDEAWMASFEKEQAESDLVDTSADPAGAEAKRLRQLRSAMVLEQELKARKERKRQLDAAADMAAAQP